MIVDLLRHGATGRDGYLDGRTDFPLSAQGRAQFEGQTSGRDWAAIVTSPSRRAREPAERLARRRGRDVRIDADWAELDFGAWDGKRAADVAAELGGREAFNAFYADPARHPPPGGEAWPDFEARVARALDRIFAESADGPVLLVSHGGPMRLVLSQVCGFDFSGLWVFRIGYGTRVQLDIGKTAQGRFWGEIVEIRQP